LQLSTGDSFFVCFKYSRGFKHLIHCVREWTIEDITFTSMMQMCDIWTNLHRVHLWGGACETEEEVREDVLPSHRSRNRRHGGRTYASSIRVETFREIGKAWRYLMRNSTATINSLHSGHPCVQPTCSDRMVITAAWST
jgi:hypothetical protein